MPIQKYIRELPIDPAEIPKETRDPDTANKITALFMGTTNIKTRLWVPFQKMTWTYCNGRYIDCKLVPTKGVEKHNPSIFPDKPPQTWVSPNFFYSRWSQRMPVSRPLNPETLEIMGLENPFIGNDPVIYSSRSGGYRKGDNHDLFPEIEPNDEGKYNFVFPNFDSFAIGIKNEPELHQLKKDELVTPKLIEGRLELYCRNRLIGYAPPYIREMFKEFQQNLIIKIIKANRETFFHRQFLLLATLDKLVGIPFSGNDYQVLELD